MDRIVLDDAMIERIRASMQTVDVYDSKGNIVGLYTPKIDRSRVSGFGPAISDDEIRRRVEAKGPRYTTAEILRDLEES